VCAQVQIVVVGTSHNTTSVQVRERLAISPESLPDALRELRERVDEVFALSTCNRVELYAVCGHEASGAELLREYLAARSGLSLSAIREATYAYGHESAVRHALRVAAGLDSMVVGENEILGQMRRAIRAARLAGSLGPILDRLGDAALTCGKRTRTATALGNAGQSVASVAIALARREHNGLDGRSVTVLGAGETAQAVISQLRSTPNVRVTVLNRTHARAVELATAHEVLSREWGELDDQLAVTDVVIGCTESQTPIVSAGALGAVRPSGAPPLLCVDLGVPRDIDPAVADLPGVRLIDVDQIGKATSSKTITEPRTLARAEQLVAQEADRYMEWWRGRDVAPTIARLHARAAAVRDAEISRALSRLPELPPQARLVIRELAMRLTSKLLHEPTVALKRDPEGMNMAIIVERLFALEASAGPENCAADRGIDHVIQEFHAS
jgi:glutamyl-tRNA reductase